MLPQEGIAEAVGCSAFEFFAELRRGDGYHQPCPLGKIFAAQVDSAVFGDYVVGLEAGGDHSRTGCEDWFDFRHPLAGG